MTERPCLTRDLTLWADTATLGELAVVLGVVERELLARGLPGSRALAGVRDELAAQADAYHRAGLPDPMADRRARRN